MARVRSPNFPVISLPQAIERIEAIYDKEQTIPATRETIAEHLGYSGLNGASLKLISALGKYGLLELVEGRGFRVSKLAMAIMHPANDAERTEALREAAAAPVLFQRLTEQFEGGRPSETNLRSWLLRNGFAKSAVDNVIRSYGETMDLVGDTRTSYSVPAVIPERKPERETMQTGRIERADPRTHESDEPFSVELLRDRFRVVGELTSREDAEKLISILSAAMAFLPERKKAGDEDDFSDPDIDDVDLDRA